MSEARGNENNFVKSNQIFLAAFTFHAKAGK